MKKTLTVILLMSAVAGRVLPSAAEAYAYHATLLDTQTGAPITGVKIIIASLYDREQGGSPLWQRKIAVSLDETGFFSTELSEAVGSAVPGGPTAAIGDVVTLYAAKALYLGIRLVDAVDLDFPRTRLTAVPYAECAESVVSAPSSFSVAGKMEATGSLTCHGKTSVSGDAIAHGNLNVRGTATFGGDFVCGGLAESLIRGDLTVGTSLGIGEGAVTGTLDVGGSAAVTKLDVASSDFTVGRASAYVKPGTIVMWTNADAVPRDWEICDGRSYVDASGTMRHTPDLTGRFIVGADGDTGSKGSYPLGATGGGRTASVTVPMLPKHTHKTVFGSTDYVGAFQSRHDGINYSDNHGQGYTTWTSDAQSGGGGDAPAHENRPCYLALFYIMKVR